MTRDVYSCVTFDYQQIANDNIANQIHGFTIDYGKFILIINRELKHARFWDADGNRKWTVFTFNLPSNNHIHIGKYLFSIRDEKYKNLGDNTVLVREMFSSGCRTRLKNARA